jgi:hypothetical protein
MACLEWLIPDLLLLDIQKLPPPDPHTHHSILSPEKELTTHNNHTCIHNPHTRHATHNSINEYQKQTCSDPETRTIFTKEYTTLKIAKYFLMVIKSYSQANNLQASI